METVLEGLGDSGALSPLSTNVHVEDFAELGDHTEAEMETANLNPDGEDEEESDQVKFESTVGVPGDEDDDPIGLRGVTADGTHSTDDLDHVEVLERVGGDHVDSEEPTQVLAVSEAQPALDNPVLDSEPALIQDGDADANTILLTTDADGNLAVPVSTEHVIRLLMQTSDGNVVAADTSVPMEAIKLSLQGLMAAASTDGGGGGDMPQTVQALTMPDGTTALIEAPIAKVEPERLTQVMPKFVEGQTIKLENGTTALLQATPREALNEGLQAIQLEDGSTAFISHPNPEGLFAAGVSQLDTSALNLDQLASQTMMAAAVDKQAEKALVIGDKAYKCLYEDCGRLYTTHHHLKVHERSHTGDRPFICEVPNCGKAFATGYGLKSHNRVHTGEKPYPCPETGCEKAFKTSGDLQKHVRTHTGERPFKCPFEGCSRSFTTSNIRKVHIRTHTGERPYICDMQGCGRAFASATNYKNHIRIHTGEKPYVCTFQGCGKRFTEYSSLYKHHVVHTHTKPYTCSHCGKTYRQTSTLAMHKRTAHGEDTPAEVLAGVTQPTTSSADHPAAGSTSSDTSGPSPSKKPRLVKSEVVAPDAVTGGDNLIQVNTADGAQMMLLAGPDGTNHQLANLVTLQTPGNLSLQELQQSGQLAGLTGLALGGEPGQQVFVVTDPSQLEALQQLAAQHLETMTESPEGGTAGHEESTAEEAGSGEGTGAEMQVATSSASEESSSQPPVLFRIEKLSP